MKTDGSSFKDGDDFDSVTHSMELAGFTSEDTATIAHSRPLLTSTTSMKKMVTITKI